MTPEELLSIAAQADFTEQTAFADQIWTVNEDGTVTIQESAGAQPTVVNLDEEDVNEEEDLPECSGSSTTNSDPSNAYESDPTNIYQTEHFDFDSVSAQASTSTANRAEPGPPIGSIQRHRRSHLMRTSFHPYRRPDSFINQATLNQQDTVSPRARTSHYGTGEDRGRTMNNR